MTDYGWVKEIPKNLKKGDYFLHETYYVSRTGNKEQYYTFYREFTASLVGYWYHRFFSFIQNLSHDKEIAMKKAYEYTQKNVIQSNIFFRELPKKEYIKFEAFNLDWKEGKKAFYAIPNQNFWKLWKEDKDKIKKQGFWISKNKRNNQFYVFFKKKIFIGKFKMTKENKK